MLPYHKINSLYKRDATTKYKTFLRGQWTQPEFELLAELEWIGTEKVDGTNIRIIWDGQAVSFAGRSDNAQLPGPLTNYLQTHFTPERMEHALQGPVTLYGEGFGGKIQKGSGYSPDQRFILFDVWAEAEPLGVWLNRETVEGIAEGLDIPAVPVRYRGSLIGAEGMVFQGFQSGVAQSELIAEGLVLRPAAELRDRMGRRIITKIKYKDYVR